MPLQLPIFDHNDIYAGTTNPLSGACGNVLQTAGNILADLLFATGPSDPLPYTLELSSPAVDTGNNNAPYLPPTDLAGQPRIQNAHNLSSAIIDMGVYEYPGVPAQVPADFSVSLDPATLSFAQGTSASTTVILTPTSGTTASVTLACTGLPVGGTCSFSPAQLDLSDGMSHSSRLSVHLSPAASTSVDPLHQRRTPVTFAAGGVALLLLFPRRRRKNLGSLLLLTMCLGASGCGEIKVPFASGPTTYHITINATSDAGLMRQAGLTLDIVP